MNNEEAMRESSARITHMLADLEGAVGPNAWPRVEALVTELVALYGEGLLRMLAHARASATDAGELDARLASDQGVASLLSLHGAHPVPLETRLERALVRVREAIGDARVEIERVSSGEITLRASNVHQVVTAGNFTAIVNKAIQHEAPEIAAIHIDGLPAAPPQKLVTTEQLVRRGAR